MKKKCCHVRMLSPNKSCSKDNLDRVIDVEQYNPLIHQQLRESKIQAVIHIFATTEGPRGKSTELFQAVVQHNVRLNRKLVGGEPRNMVHQLLETWPKQQRLKFLADVLHFNTAAFRGYWDGARATGRHLHLCFFFEIT